MKKFIVGIVLGICATLFGELVTLNLLLKNKTFRAIFVNDLSDLITNFLHGNKTYSRNQSSRITYDRPARRPSKIHGYRRIPNVQVKQDHNLLVNQFIVSSREDAERVWEAMYNVITQNGTLTRADLKELLGLPLDYKDTWVGWTSIDECKLESVREGYLINLPEVSYFT